MFVSATPPANFTASTALVAPNSPGANNPALPDVTFTYTGTAVLGPQTFTGFVIAALAGTTQTTDDYFAQSHNPANQQVRSTTGTTTVGAAGPALVPEPATVGLASLGFAVLALSRRRRGCTGSEPRQ
jgi:hypothetical protein